MRLQCLSCLSGPCAAAALALACASPVDAETYGWSGVAKIVSVDVRDVGVIFASDVASSASSCPGSYSIGIPTMSPYFEPMFAALLSAAAGGCDVQFWFDVDDTTCFTPITRLKVLSG